MNRMCQPMRFAPLSLSFATLQPTQQTYLACVVNIVKRNSPELGQQLLPLRRRSSQLCHSLPQGAVFAIEQLFVSAPRRLGIRTRLRTRKKVASFQGKGAAFTAFNSAPQGVFPVRRVKRHFPDVVTAAAGTPSRLLRRHPAQRLLQIWSVPSALFIGFIEQGKNEIGGIHGGLSQETKMY